MKKIFNLLNNIIISFKLVNNLIFIKEKEKSVVQ